MTIRNSATMTVTDAAAVLGISRTTAYECVRRGEIPAIRLGGRIIVPTQAIEDLLSVARRPVSDASEDSSATESDTLF